MTSFRFLREALSDLFSWWVVAMIVLCIAVGVLVTYTGSAASALNPPVKYVGDAPCRTVKIGKGFFQMDGEFYRVTHLTLCGKRVTARIQAVTP